MSLYDGAGAYALVKRYCDCYLVLSFKSGKRDYYEAKVKNDLKKQLAVDVDWVAAMNRRHQRLFGWGDVVTTRDDVVQACKSDDAQELLAIFPPAARLQKDGDVDLILLVYDAMMQPDLPQITDCPLTTCKGGGVHAFFLEGSQCSMERSQGMKRAIMGPCARDPRHRGASPVATRRSARLSSAAIVLTSFVTAATRRCG